MGKEKLPTILDTSIKIGLFSAVSFLLTFAFTYESKKTVLEKAKGKCERCKKKFDELDVSHINHSPDIVEGLDYDNPLRGEALCHSCHYDYHVQHIGTAKHIGLSEIDNLRALDGIWAKLSESKRNGRTSPSYYWGLMRSGLLSQ